MDQRAKVIVGDSRCMREIEDRSIDLVVTSPPYWHIKDYGTRRQIGHGQTLHGYLRDLDLVWRECHRVLRAGRRLCVNVGDQFARSSVYGRYKVIPIHAEVIAQCEGLGFDFMGSIIWQKRTTMNTSGGANVMGSFPFPPNGMVEIDYEYILIFKKPGEGQRIPKGQKEGSRLTKDEWKGFFSGHWRFGGSRQVGHEAMFPEELPRRLIKMFTFKGERVLDPFLGSGTTLKVALDLGRGGVGYEVNPRYLDLVRERLSEYRDIIDIVKNRRPGNVPHDAKYVPRIQDAAVPPDEGREGERPELPRVVQIIDEGTLLLDDGRVARLGGVDVRRKAETRRYLQRYVLGKPVRLKEVRTSRGGDIKARVYLKNGIFINGYLVKTGLASRVKV